MDNGSNYIEEILSNQNAQFKESDNKKEKEVLKGKIFQNINNNTSNKSIVSDK